MPDIIFVNGYRKYLGRIHCHGSTDDIEDAINYIKGWNESEYKCFIINHVNIAETLGKPYYVYNVHSF